MRIALVITTYQRPDALAAVLATVAQQTRRPDELIVADDGSEDATREIIAQFAASAPFPVIHHWQEHQGFRLTRLRNGAIALATSELIVFVDGDMLLHSAFLADHERIARPGCFTQGMRIHLDPETTERLLAAPGTYPKWNSTRLGLRRIYAWHAPSWSRLARDVANGFIAIKGCNQAYWRSDLVAVNGFNEAMVGWGPEDKEIAARLAHHGIRRQTLLFGGIAWHLHHPPASRERRAENEAVLRETRRHRLVRCAEGLDSHRAGAQSRGARVL